MPVVDASVLIEDLAGGEGGGRAREALFSADEELWAPHLIDAETGHVLRRAVISGEIAPATAEAALEELAVFPLHRAGHVGLLERTWTLRNNVSFYDGLYVALAERLGMPLITLDARLSEAPGVTAEIRVL